MITIHNKLYPLKVWLVSILLATIVFTFYDNIDQLGGLFGEFVTIGPINLIVGIPGAVVFGLGFVWINQADLTISQKKWCMSLLGSILFLATWFGLNMLFGRYIFFSSKSIFICADFCFCITICCFLFAKTSSERR